MRVAVRAFESLKQLRRGVQHEQILTMSLRFGFY
jgi:hypothetical protein